jgi:DNA-binding IclR family transcriptional regulator
MTDRDDFMAGTNSINQVSDVLDLFDERRSLVTVDDIAIALKIPRSSAYRTLRAMTEIGFLDRVSAEGYALGPRIMELYRHLQLGNPLLAAARPVMVALAAEVPRGSAVLLCRGYRDKVMCVHQEMTLGPQDRVSYQVGRPMPLYRGSSSLAVLAVQDRARLVKLYERDKAEIKRAGLGASQEAFLANLKAIRKAGHRVSRGEVDKGRVGISAPFEARDIGIAGCIGIVLSEPDTGETQVSRAVLQAATAARSIADRLAQSEPVPAPRRTRTARAR